MDPFDSLDADFYASCKLDQMEDRLTGGFGKPLTFTVLDDWTKTHTP